jgi:hypothetical protein
VPSNNCTQGTTSTLGAVAEEQMLHFAFEAKTQVSSVLEKNNFIIVMGSVNRIKQ